MEAIAYLIVFFGGKTFRSSSPIAECFVHSFLTTAPHLEPEEVRNSSRKVRACSSWLVAS